MSSPYWIVRAAYEIRSAPEAVFARRLRMDAAFVQDGGASATTR